MSTENSTTMNEAVLQLEGNSKANKTKMRYNSTNNNFILWLYQNKLDYPGAIKSEFLPKLDEAYEKDQSTITRRSRAVSVNGGGSGADDGNGMDSKKNYKYFRETVIDLLEKTHPSARNCPINMRFITYEIFATYLSSLKTNDNKLKGMSTYDGTRSSIMHLMKLDNVFPDHECKEKVCNLLKGFRRTIQQQKVELDLSLEEGKDPLSFTGYNLLCRTFLKNNGTNDEFIFAQCFLTLE